MQRRFAAIVLGLVAGACTDSTAPAAAAAGLTLEAQPSHFDTNIGVPARITYALRNDSDGPVTVVFLGCGVRPFVARFRGPVVHPSGGEWGCYANVTAVTLAPDEALVQTVYVAGGEEVSYDQGTLLLPVGHYRAYAKAEFHLNTVDGPRIELRSRMAFFRIGR